MTSKVPSSLPHPYCFHIPILCIIFCPLPKTQSIPLSHIAPFFFYKKKKTSTNPFHAEPHL